MISINFVYLFTCLQNLQFGFLFLGQVLCQKPSGAPLLQTDQEIEQPAKLIAKQNLIVRPLDGRRFGGGQTGGDE